MPKRRHHYALSLHCRFDRGIIKHVALRHAQIRVLDLKFFSGCAQTLSPDGLAPTPHKLAAGAAGRADDQHAQPVSPAADECVTVSERLNQPDDQNDFPHPWVPVYIAMQTVLPAQSGEYSALRFLGDLQYHLTARVVGLSLFVRFGGIAERQHLRHNRLDFLLLD